MAKELQVKKRCCQSGPRCRRCPVVAKRLAAAGLATRTGKRTYELSGDVRKRDVKDARKR
jgi:hypothetical protein